jgi:hypothetical protein
MSYETSLEAEITRLAASLADLTEPQTFAAELVRGQLESRLAEARGELKAAQNRALELRFAAEDEPERHSIETGVLGTILTRVQSCFNYMRWALESGPGVSGDVPSWVARSARTETFAFSPGSFKVSLRQAELELEPHFEKLAGILLDLAETGKATEPSDEVDDAIADIGPEAVSRLERLFKKLADESLITTFDWKGSSGRAVTVQPDESRLIADWLAASTPEVENLNIVGILRMADSDTRRFAIEQDGGERLEGRSDVNLTGTEIDALYRASVVITHYRSQRTDAHRQRTTLIHLEKVRG